MVNVLELLSGEEPSFDRECSVSYLGVGLKVQSIHITPAYVILDANMFDHLFYFRWTTAYPDTVELVSRTTCDRVKAMTVSWCIDKQLVDIDDIEWLLCWHLLRQSVLAFLSAAHLTNAL